MDHDVIEANGWTPMPPKVAGAVAAVMGAVPKLAKGEKNSHGNYNFASIDDFLEAVRPLCAEHGLIILQDEESFDMRDGWLVMRFRFTLAHSSGETWSYRPTRTIMVSSKMGSQAFGAAQSYALKQFERSLFQIATGEKDADADSHPPADLPQGRSRSNGNGQRQAKPAHNASEPWKTDAERLKKAIDATESTDGMDQLFKAEGNTLKTIKEHSESAYEFLVDRANKRTAALSNKPPTEGEAA